MEFFQSIALYSPFGLLILRLALGIIFLYHGWMKFGMWKMQPSEQMPSSMLTIMKTLSIVETVVGMALILGVYVQIAAIVPAVIMLGAIYFKIFKWGKKFAGDGGWELDFILLAASIAIILSGSSAFSLL